MSGMQHSLLIPCYRAARFLPELANQINGLEPAFDEIILIDDGSDDETFEVARSLDLPIERLSKNIGPGAARNQLAALASGTWIHFLDADDRIGPQFLRHTTPLTKPQVDVILCAGEFIDSETSAVQKRWEFDASSYISNPVEAAFVTPIPTFCSFIRRSAFLDVGGFDESKRCWEDGDLHLRLAAAGSKFTVTDKVLSISPRHDEGASASHLYCHRCRLEFAESYLEKGYAISDRAFAKEFRQLGELFLGEKEWKYAERAFRHYEKCGGDCETSRIPPFRWLLSHLRPAHSQLLSAAARTTVRTLTHR